MSCDLNDHQTTTKRQLSTRKTRPRRTAYDHQFDFIRNVRFLTCQNLYVFPALLSSNHTFWNDDCTWTLSVERPNYFALKLSFNAFLPNLSHNIILLSLSRNKCFCASMAVLSQTPLSMTVEFAEAPAGLESVGPPSDSYEIGPIFFLESIPEPWLRYTDFCLDGAVFYGPSTIEAASHSLKQRLLFLLFFHIFARTFD